MGQLYLSVILKASGKIMAWMSAHRYGNGAKLMEHSYVGNNFVSTFEYGLSPQGPYHKSRVVWAGGYADEEPGSGPGPGKNLSSMCDETSDLEIRPEEKSTEIYRFVVNHTKKQFVDKTRSEIHPLPLLTCEGNGLGGGDYSGTNEELVGSWARDIISVESSAPDGFQELAVRFDEC
jgi:hypothetical protein